MTDQVHRAYGWERYPRSGTPDGETVTPWIDETEYPNLSAIAVSKRFWGEACRAAALSTALRALNGETQDTRALKEAAHRFWDGTLVQQTVTNHAVAVEAI
ncbi:hypothetical protein [Methanofollis fontis]|uniref:Uncharacterized protein n=1 Tax=Methanofollis fontis TaxID=2052832 RepID=A0A483CUG4_9EURY|nr:hypothetical protein [Methanofollis fontis]TAJ44948.1 hypothetical protein CUJ86_06620 [Methanofollis fontis]